MYNQSIHYWQSIPVFQTLGCPNYFKKIPERILVNNFVTYYHTITYDLKRGIMQEFFSKVHLTSILQNSCKKMLHYPWLFGKIAK